MAEDEIDVILVRFRTTGGRLGGGVIIFVEQEGGIETGNVVSELTHNGGDIMGAGFTV